MCSRQLLPGSLLLGLKWFLRAQNPCLLQTLLRCFPVKPFDTLNFLINPFFIVVSECISGLNWAENIVKEAENIAHDEQFHLVSKCFSYLLQQVPFKD